MLMDYAMFWQSRDLTFLVDAFPYCSIFLNVSKLILFDSLDYPAAWILLQLSVSMYRQDKCYQMNLSNEHTYQ